MKNLFVRMIVSALAILAMAAHLTDNVKFGREALVLLSIAFLPWLSEFIDSFKLGKDSFEIKMREIEKKADAAIDASIRGVAKKPQESKRGKSPGIRSDVPDESRADDPNFGKFGGRPEANGRKLSAVIEKIPGEDYFRRVILRVESTDSKRPLEGKVTFYLHSTFDTPNCEQKVKDGVAQTSIISYGAFTVGAEADDGETRLELDLASLRSPGDKFFDR